MSLSKFNLAKWGGLFSRQPLFKRLLRSKLEPMETITIESIPIMLGREEDGRWWADIESCQA
jgi:hypothetical protein